MIDLLLLLPPLTKPRTFDVLWKVRQVCGTCQDYPSAGHLGPGSLRVCVMLSLQFPLSTETPASSCHNTYLSHIIARFIAHTPQPDRGCNTMSNRVSQLFPRRRHL